MTACTTSSFQASFPAPTPAPAKVDDTDDYKTALIGAKALLKYAESKEEKADIQSYIKGLEVMLK
jgi:hypothetical protein